MYCHKPYSCYRVTLNSNTQAIGFTALIDKDTFSVQIVDLKAQIQKIEDLRLSLEEKFNSIESYLQSASHFHKLENDIQKLQDFCTKKQEIDTANQTTLQSTKKAAEEFLKKYEEQTDNIARNLESQKLAQTKQLSELQKVLAKAEELLKPKNTEVAALNTCSIVDTHAAKLIHSINTRLFFALIFNNPTLILENIDKEPSLNQFYENTPPNTAKPTSFYLPYKQIIQWDLIADSIFNPNSHFTLISLKETDKTLTRELTKQKFISEFLSIYCKSTIIHPDKKSQKYQTPLEVKTNLFLFLNSYQITDKQNKTTSLTRSPITTDSI